MRRLWIVLMIAGCEGDGREDAFFSDAEWKAVKSLAGVPATPADPTNAVADDPGAAALGQKLYFDPNFSSTRTISCASCHDPAKGFSDGLPTSSGVGVTSRNASTVFNSAHNRFQFWDGRKDSLWSQALGPIESDVEHDFSRTAVVRRIYRAYQAEFEAVFGALPDFSDTARFPDCDPPAFSGQGRPGDGPGGAGLDTYDEMAPADQALVNLAFSRFGKAIAAYERLIVSRNSAFDAYANGGDLSASAKRGLKLFIGKAFCVNCHSGPNLMDDGFNNAGVAGALDLGRFNGVPPLLADPFNGAGAFSDDPATGAAKLAGVLQTASQTGQFKTPTLRSVSQSGPYFHNGKFASLWDVVDFYNRGGDQSGFAGTADVGIQPLNLDEQQVRDIVEFLKTLDGEALPAALTSAPPGIPGPAPGE